jgi:protoporphyrinogen IX oxidase
VPAKIPTGKAGKAKIKKGTFSVGIDRRLGLEFNKQAKMNGYLYLKALHLIAVVSWFAGLLYIVRLFIYHVEADAKPNPEKTVLQSQFTIMERRLWFAITWPAMLATAIFGTWLMILTQAWLSSWFQLKIGFLVLLFIYHFLCGKIRSDLAQGRCKLTSVQLRIWNEVATLLLFSIIFTAVLKSPWAAGKSMLWVLGIAVLSFVSLALLRKRKRNG